MALSNVLLIKPVEHLGSEGDQISVRSGYARNYLIPRSFAVVVNQSNVRQIETLKARRKAREAKDMATAEALMAQVKAFKMVFAVQTGEGGKMFGAITAQDLVSRFAAEGIALEKKQVSLATPAKALGVHAAKIKLHSSLVFDFEFEVVSENPIES
jgi:large subunit ribosomal protein L9